MYTQQVVKGPIAPVQVAGPIGYYPVQTTTDTSDTGSTITDMLNSFMPLIMMVAMMGMMIPLFKSMGGPSAVTNS